MRQALALAEQGRGLTSPNPTVGAVVVRDGVIAGRGYHVYAQRDHAEIVALRQAGAQAQGATLYVTLEPCSHWGRTGPCTEAILQAGIRRVVAAMQDPNPLVAGKGFDQLRAAGVQVELATEFTQQAREVNRAYVHFMETGRPLVILKAALTLDGKIAAPDDNRGWITSAQARQHVQMLRHYSDAILTGIGTVLADDCLLTDRTGLPRSRPLLRIVLDSQLRLPLQSRLVNTAQQDLLVATTSAASAERRHALEKRGIEVLTFDGPDGRVDVRSLIQLLAERKYLSLLVEGGSKVNWTLLEQGIADQIFFYYAPKILGGTQSLPVAGGPGRRTRQDALQFHNLRLHRITDDEFAVEAWLNK
jgi:diaminohydroxyphosphoribosylaminopyrimidine deaminase/5-amino-6-(5-phosphoribosylamino)uracil reductase